MTTSDELRKIEEAIQGQEALLGQNILPDEQIQATLAALRSKQATYQADLSGSGTLTQGNDNTTLGPGAVHVDGNIGGDVVTGAKITQTAGQDAIQIGQARDVKIERRR